jgi:hypothetical protein
MGEIRIGLRNLPGLATKCEIPKQCVYRDANGICDDPRINKANGDSACHRMNNKDVLAILKQSAKTI